MLVDLHDMYIYILYITYWFRIVCRYVYLNIYIYTPGLGDMGFFIFCSNIYQHIVVVP